MRRAAEENRKVAVVKSAISTLSFSEMEAITHIFDELNGMEGILVASKIADQSRYHQISHCKCLKKV